MRKNDVIQLLEKVKHPAIDYSLIKLGIFTEINVVERKVEGTFAFPFLNIPIADKLIQLVSTSLNEENFELDYQVRVMTDEERNRFLKLENEAWKGL